MSIQKHGHENLKKKRPLFFLIGLISALSVTLSAFEYKTFYDVESFDDFTDITVDEMDQDLIAIKIEKIPDIPQPKVKPQPQPTPEPVPQPDPDPLPKDPIEPVVDPNTDIPIIGMGDEKPVEEEIPTVIYAEHPATFIGGEAEMFKYLSEKLDFKKFNLTDSYVIYVTFVIDEHGNPTQIEILRGVNSRVDKMILDVVESMPAWEPAKQGGRTVRQRFNLPIKYHQM